MMKGIPVQIDLDSIFDSDDPADVGKKLRVLAKHSIYFHSFNSRSFHNPRNYLSWNEFVTSIALNLVSMDNLPAKYLDYGTLNSSILLREIYEKQAATFPCYWLDENLLRAFLNTDLPDVMGLKRTHQYGTIFLPQNVLRSPDGYSVNWIIFTHRLKGEESTVQLLESAPISHNYTEDVLQVFTSLGWKNVLYFSACSLERTGTDKLPYRESLVESVAEKTFVDNLLSITLQCLLWLQTRPPQESTPSAVGFKPRVAKGNEPLNPRWIGKGYKPKQITSKIGSYRVSGDRCSPRTHWRRGHWRSQRIGSGRSQIKSTWIEPILVNG